MRALSVFAAALSFVAAVDSLPQLIDTLDQPLGGSRDSIFNSDSPQNGIPNSDFSTNSKNMFGSPDVLADPTKSTENVQLPAILSNSPTTLLSYDLPSSELSTNSDASSNSFISSILSIPSNPDISSSSSTPSNPDISSGSGTPSNPDISSSSNIPSGSDDLSLTSPDQQPTNTVVEDSSIAQELLIPKGGLAPQIGVPRVLPPTGSDVIPPVPDSQTLGEWDWVDEKPNTANDPDEANHPPDCKKMKGNNPRTAMCCAGGAPRIQGSKTGEIDPRKWAYDCYNPYFPDHEYLPDPNPPPAPIPGPPYRDMHIQSIQELGIEMVGIPALPGRQRWKGPEGGPQGSNVGRYGGSQAHVGSCAREYLVWLDVTPKVDPSRNRGVQEVP
ncbi:hypothetical protein MMC29_002622 [Sticta canariensis]|nr:hypothetical protein [Sticta canariensis]